jgi:phage tail sheath gpL-like
MPTFVFPTLPANDRTPGHYAYVRWAQGDSSGGTAPYRALIIANKLSTGTASDGYVYGPDTVVPLSGASDAATLFGARSEAANMYRHFIAVNPTTPCYVITVPESSGSKATGTISVSGTSTTACAVRIFLNANEHVDASVVAGDSNTTIASAIATAINSKPEWCITASASGANVTVTAVQKGERGNSIRISALVLPNGSSISVSPSVRTNLTGGTGSDDNSDALDVVLSQRFYYIVSAANDSTQLGALVTQVETQALPNPGIRQRVIAGSASSLAVANALATTINAPRAEIVWLAQSDWTPSELAAHQAGVIALNEDGENFRTNLAGYGNSPNERGTWRVPAPLSGASPTHNEINSAINNGLSPIRVLPNGRTSLVNRFTTYTLNGSNVDYRIADSHKVTVADKFTDDWLAECAARFNGKKIGDDPGANEFEAPDVVTPRKFKMAIISILRAYESRALLENVSTTISRLVVTRAGSRMQCIVPLDIRDILTQTATQVDQVG